MSSKHFCDRPICSKEITGRPYRVQLPLNKELDLCPDSCAKELEGWLYKEPEKQDE